ncbi:hypothetical protein F5X96DRAFT_682087 [Biscogniauxia mediterranea]|nr:hypothetical protein F5X96DRAFT_682087 [Biscogniauxia mediterranea]
MPKRNSDSMIAMSVNDRMPPVKAQKTERSHEENQERAYIAASRRADRSLEARVQSAKMASEIHRKRTGRGLKVNEEIVLKEEMYEEEEDEIPRHYKYLTAHLQTNSPEMNHRVNAFITTQTAMATMARYNEVNRLFSESFPSAMAYQQQLRNSMYMTPLLNTGVMSSHSTQSSPTTATSAASAQSQLGRSDRKDSTVSACSTSDSTTVSSPPALSPASTTTDTPDSRRTPFQTPTAFPNLPLDPQSCQESVDSSAFTSELPNEVKMMANIDMNDPMAAHFLGNTSSFPMYDQYLGDTSSEGQNVQSQDASTGVPNPTDNYECQEETLFSPIEDSMRFIEIPFTGYSRLGTPSCVAGNDAAWECLIDYGCEQ